ncbi:MAG: beta-lactamase family protein, partial [Chloroflexi bacterium]|nr:beta-lactamase family protein [Chloroflexota bacterium]
MNRSSALKKIKHKRFHALCSQIVTDMKRLNVPGVSVAVLHGDDVHSAGFGVTNVDHPLPVTADTLFQIGSISKTITATLIMQLVEAGKLDLDTPVRTIIPSLKLADPIVSEQVTTRHLLTHLGGWMGDYFNDYGNGNDALDKMVKSLIRLPQITPLGQVWSYNNAGFNIAGRIIEVLTKMSYEHAAHTMLLRPIGMHQSFFYPDDTLLTKRFAVGHQKWDGEPRVAVPWAIGRAANAVGGVISTVTDLIRYAQFHCGDGQGIIDRSTLLQMRAVQTSAGGRGDMGLTWFIRHHDSFSSYGHGGATKGQKATFRFIPDKQFAIAVLTNSDEGSIIGDAAVTRALDLFLGTTSVTPETIYMSDEDLQPYVGRYEYALWSFEVTAQNGHLVAQENPKSGFPKPETPAGPPVAPVRLAFIGPDKFVSLDEPRKGEIGDFVRNDAGEIAYFRIGGRANPRAH